jgi:hypothetical protein
MSCALTVQAADGYMLNTQGDAESQGSEVVGGLFPDGVRSVTITFEDGSSQDVAVESNVLSAVVSKVPASVTFSDARGLKRTKRLAAH